MAQEKADAGKAEVFLTTDFTDGTDGEKAKAENRESGNKSGFLTTKYAKNPNKTVNFCFLFSVFCFCV